MISSIWWILQFHRWDFQLNCVSIWKIGAFCILHDMAGPMEYFSEMFTKMENWITITKHSEFGHRQQAAIRFISNATFALFYLHLILSIPLSLSLSECHFLNECTHTVRRKKKWKKSTANFQAITWCKWGKEKQNDERTVVVQRIIRKSARTTTTAAPAAAAATTTKRKLNRHNGIHNIIAKSRLCCGTKCQQTSQIKK